MSRQQNKRSDRFTAARYEEAAELQTIHAETKRLWPKRWIFFGHRWMPVAIFLAAMAKRDHSANKLENRLRAKVSDLEHRIARHEKVAARTQEYIAGVKGRLAQAAEDGSTVAEYLKADRARARDHWHKAG